MLADDLAFALDPVEFARGVGIEPDEWQRDVLTGGHERALLLCSRQSGKSTVSALVALHTALFEGPALVLLVSPSQRQSGELFKTLMALYRRLAGAAEPTMESALRAEFPNGSRIISLPGSEATVRGYSAARLVVVDEAARVPDDLLAAVRPTLATTARGGRLLALSTPFGRRGWFFKAWTFGGEAWARYRVTAEDCPRISRTFLEEERRELGELRFAAEYLCEFHDTEGSVFPDAIVRAALSREVQPLWAA